MRRVAAVLALTVLAPGALEGQNSVYGIRGVGFPSRAVSLRARSMGGGWAVFDHGSAVNPATAAHYVALAASGYSGTTLRKYTANATDVSGLRETRFPFAVVGGGMGRLPFSFAISYATYAEQTFDFTTTGTAEVAGVPVSVSDRISADGGVIDIRGAVGWRASGRRLTFGGAFHLIGGSSKIEASREFPNAEFRRYEESGDMVFSAVGVSTGLLWQLRPSTFVAAAVRYDGSMSRKFEGRRQGNVDLPLSVSGGLSLPLARQAWWSTTATWRSWGKAHDDLDPDLGGSAFDTWEVGSGMEIGSPIESFPLRFGVRYATLPFSPMSEQPHEWSVAVGSGFALADGRALIDFTLERLMRDGAGATERGWFIGVGLTVEP